LDKGTFSLKVKLLHDRRAKAFIFLYENPLAVKNLQNFGGFAVHERKCCCPGK
jgi:hypothetical protein